MSVRDYYCMLDFSCGASWAGSLMMTPVMSFINRIYKNFQQHLPI